MLPYLCIYLVVLDCLTQTLDKQQYWNSALGHCDTDAAQKNMTAIVLILLCVQTIKMCRLLCAKFTSTAVFCKLFLTANIEESVWHTWSMTPQSLTHGSQSKFG